MGYTYYSYLAYITSDSAADLPGLHARLQASFAQLQLASEPLFTLADNELTITLTTYHFTIHYATEAHVHEEAQEFAADSPVDLTGQPVDPARLGACTRRFELRGDPDPDMDYFNDSLTILEALEEFEGVIVLELG